MATQTAASTTPKKTFRLPVLDFLRGLAIICVVLDHTFGWLGLQNVLTTAHHYTIFSVAPLFFLAGVTYALSFLKRPPTFHVPVRYDSPLFAAPAGTVWNYLRYIWRKSQKIITAYLIGTLIILLWQTRSFSLAQYWENLRTFPFQFYFIAIYIELLCVAPLLLKAWQYLATLWRKFSSTVTQPSVFRLFFPLVCLCPLLVLSLLCRQIHLLPPPIWEPAQQLFGGIELFIFGSGTLAGFLYQQNRLKLTRQRKIGLFFAGLLGLLFIIFTDKQAVMFAHPPNFWTIVYANSGLAFFTGLYYFFNRLHLPTWLDCRRFFIFFGQHSLDIFIYHSLFIREILLRWPQITDFSLVWQLLFITLIAGNASIALTWLIDHALKLLASLTKAVSRYFAPDRL